MTTDIPKSSGIYRITCTSTGKIYIGSAVNLRRRQYHHWYYLSHQSHKNPKLQAAWNKYGEEAFTFDVLELVLLPELLTAREQYWFNKLKPFGKKGYNISPTAGSSLGFRHSPEAREKMRKDRLGKKLSEEHKRKIGDASKGKPRPPEIIEKMRIANLGREFSATHRANIRASAIGRKLSPETREKLSIAGRGRTMSESARALFTSRNETLKKTFIITAPDGTEHTVHGLKPFCREHSLNSSAMIAVAKGRYRQHKGWKARYLGMS